VFCDLGQRQVVIGHEQRSVPTKDAAKSRECPRNFAKLVQHVEEEHDIDARVRYRGKIVGRDGLKLTEVVPLRTALHALQRERMDVHGEDTSLPAHEFGRRNRERSGAAAEVEHSHAGADSRRLEEAPWRASDVT